MKKILSLTITLFIYSSAFAQLDFQPLVKLPNLGGGEEVSIADFDGDGDKDFIFATTDMYPAVYAKRNNLGDYSAEPIQITPLFTDNPNAFYTVPFIVLDYDNDGKDEVVAYDQVDNGSTERITIYKFDGEKFFVFKKLPTTNDFNIRQLRHGDINKDGKVDFLYSSNVANKIYYLQSGLNDNYTLKDFSTEQNFPNQFVLGDMDGDTWPDIIHFDLNFKITIHKNNQAGGFTFNQNLGATFTNIVKIAIGDLNNDNKNDIAVLGNYTDYIEIFTQNSSNTFTSSKISFAATTGNDIQVYDFNNDSKQDILLAGSINVSFTQFGFIMLDNNGNGFDFSFYTEPSLGPTRLKYVHLDGDLNTEIITMNGGKNILVHTREPSSVEFKSNIPFGSILNFSKTADLNKDGYEDIIATNVWGNSITIYFGNGDGTFKKPKYLVTEGPPYDLEIADFNNDGKPDIVYSINSSPNASVGFFLTDAQGNLSIKKTHSGATGIYMVVNDFNKDGYTDFYNGSDIHYGSSSGNLITYSPGIYNVSSIATGDYNADGFGDLAIGTPSGVTILKGKSGFFMDPWQNLFTTDPVAEVADININQDLYSDLIVITGGGPVLRYLNNSGTFTETSLTISGAAQKAISADFNKDTFTDIAILADNNKINILTGNGAGIFTLFNTFSTSPDFFNNLHAANINSDQKTDLVLLPSGSGYATLMLNDLVIEPTQKPEAITVTDITDVNASISFSKGDGDGRIMLIREKTNDAAEPTDNLFYVADSKFGSGSKLGNNNFVVLAADKNSIDVTNLKEGTEYEITAYEYSANSKKTVINYLTSAFATGSFKTKKSQTINPISLSSKIQTDPPFTVNATATSGLSVAAELVSGGVTINNNIVTIVNPGPITLKLKQSGNSEFAPAPDLEVTFCVNPVMPAIAYAAAADDKFTLTSSSTTNNIWLKNNIAIAGGTNQTIEVNPDASYTVKVDYSGCSSTSLPVANQTINFPAISAKEEGQPDFSLTASANSSLPISYEVVSGGITITNSTVKITTPGPAKIKASQAGNSDFFPATSVEQTFCVNPKVPTITVNTTGPGQFTLTSSSDNNNNWLKNGVSINGANAKTFEPKEDGVYSVKVDFSGCSNTSAPTSNLITGLEELINSISLYPNPSNGLLTIEWPQQSVRISKITLLDAQGKRYDLKYEINGNYIHASMSNTPDGLYVLSVESENGVVPIKVIKN